MESTHGYVGLEEAARLLQVLFWRVRYAHQAGHVEEPPRIGHRRVYSPQMLEKLRAYFANQGTSRSAKESDQRTGPLPGNCS
jgi:hypothetical protein